MKRKRKKDAKRPGPKGVRLVIEGDWKDAMTASVLKDDPIKGYKKK